MIFATLDPVSGQFHITRRNVKLPERTSDLAFNASVQRHLSAGMQAYVNDAFLGKDGPRGRNFNMRWLGAAVGDMHRIMQRGGLFFYVNDSRPGYEKGRLRLVYEANPIAFLAREAGARRRMVRDLFSISFRKPITSAVRWCSAWPKSWISSANIS